MVEEKRKKMYEEKRRKVILLCSILIGIFLINLVSGYDCKISGCPLDYRCMANGECTPLTVKAYCEDHGKPFYIYADELLSRNCSKILNPEEEKLCIQCRGDYELRKTVSDIETIIFGIAAGIAILLLSINAVKLITSDDLKGRENAKKAIMYVILGLILIISATKFIEYLLA